MSQPKVLFIDIETAPILAHVWGLWKNNVGLNQIDCDWYIMSYAAKWMDEDKVYYNDNRGKGEDDSELLNEMWGLLDEADIVVAHNGNKFDVPKINARFIASGFTPPSPFKVVDTLLEAKKNFRFTSNKLAYLAEALDVGHKLTHSKFPGHTLWVECMNNNEEAWEEMKLYNIEDTVVLERVFKKMLPWTRSMNYGLYVDDEDKSVCPKCGGDHLHSRGFAYTTQGKYQRYQCQTCGGWSRGKENLIPSDERKELKRNVM